MNRASPPRKHTFSLPIPESNPHTKYMPNPSPPTSPLPPPAGPLRRWHGVKPVPLGTAVAAFLLLRFAVPRPHQLTHHAWTLLAFFLSAVLGLILSPLPPGAWSFLVLSLLLLTRTLPFVAALSAFTNEVIWLIVISFFFARGVVKTGLGDRVATYFVKWLGKSTLGLSYGLVVAEAVVAAAMPSGTARAGGIFFPVIRSLSFANGSKPEAESRRKIGAFLVMAQLQVKVNRIPILCSTIKVFERAHSGPTRILVNCGCLMKLKLNGHN